MSDEKKSEFESAGEKVRTRWWPEIFQMLKENKKYWMIPIILILLVAGLLILLGGSAIAPFLYPLF